MPGKSPDVIRRILPLLFLATGIFLCFLTRKAPIGDFGNYYFGSKLWLQGTPSSVIYDACSFNETIRRQPGMEKETFFLNYTPVPPASLVFYAPFTLLPWQQAKAVFNILGLFIFCFSLYRFLQRMPKISFLLLAMPLVFVLPLKSNMQEGQAYLWMAACLLECLQARKPFLAGLFIALAAALKLYPLVLLIYFLAKRDYSTVKYTVFWFLILYCGAGALAGIQTLSHYSFYIIPRLLQNEINDPYAINYQTVFVLLKRWLVGDDLLNPVPLVNAPVAFEILAGILSGLFFYLAFLGIKKCDDPNRNFALAVILGFVASAYSSTYSLFLLIVPALAWHDHPRRTWLAVWLFLLCCLPVPLLAKAPPALQFLKAAVMLAFFFTWLPAGAVQLRKPALAYTLAAFAGLRLFLYSPARDGSTYYMKQDADMLLCRYSERNGYLILEGFDEHGRASDSFPSAASFITDRKLVIEGGQVKIMQDVNGARTITGGRDQKKTPSFLPDSSIVYLSDRNRGVGFYALRKINVSQHAAEGF